MRQIPCGETTSIWILFLLEASLVAVSLCGSLPPVLTAACPGQPVAPFSFGSLLGRCESRRYLVYPCDPGGAEPGRMHVTRKVTSRAPYRSDTPYTRDALQGAFPREGSRES